MKIMIYTPHLALAGAEHVVVDLACELQEQGCDVMVFVLKDNPNNKLSNRLENQNIKVIYSGDLNKGGFFSRKIRKLRIIKGVLKCEKPDIIHCHLDQRFMWLYCLIFNQRIIHTFHSQAYRYKNLRFELLYFLLRKRKLIYPTFLTQGLANEFKNLYDIKLKDYAVVANPVNCTEFTPKDFYNDDNHVVFTFVARFHPVKNHKMLLKAFKVLLEKKPECRLILVGDGDLFCEMKTLSNMLGINENVSFLGSRDDVSELLKQSDVAVIPSYSEAFSLAALEAMATGLPIVATNVGGLNEIIKGNGILVENDNYIDFAEAMYKLADDNGLRKEMGKKSLENVMKFSTASIVADYLKAYEHFYNEG